MNDLPISDGFRVRQYICNELTMKKMCVLSARLMVWLVVAAGAIGSVTAAGAEKLASNLAPYAEPNRREECQSNELAMSECAGEMREHSSKYLERLSQEITQLISRARQAAFQAAQDAWAKAAKADCDFDASSAAGNSAGSVHARCMHSQNKARIAILYRYLACLNEPSCQIQSFCTWRAKQARKPSSRPAVK